MQPTKDVHVKITWDTALDAVDWFTLCEDKRYFSEYQAEVLERAAFRIREKLKGVLNPKWDEKSYHFQCCCGEAACRMCLQCPYCCKRSGCANSKEILK